ncbi:MAG: M23 family metallopeptidase [Spirochaetales bacterium]|nr:MAG: M23 family metallopeptidase [Spirochaetales bacterium]
MKIQRRTERSDEALVRLARPGTLRAVVAVLVFGFFFLGSETSVPPVLPDSMGSADFSDISMKGLSDGLPDGLSILEEEAPPDEGLYYSVYKVVRGDTVSQIADVYDVTVDSIVTFNRITNTRTLSIGKLLKIPSMNGILYDPKKGDTPASISLAFNISEERIKEVNGIDDDTLTGEKPIFLPDARLSSFALREINGDLFKWPIRGWITSWYGWRDDPFTGERSFHTGIDVGSSVGVAVYAAMEGVVAAVGYSTAAGNYLVISHHSRYSTMYAHLSSTAVRVGQRVSQYALIGRVGTTGYSTGPHLHFTVSKNGRTINPMTVLR